IGDDDVPLRRPDRNIATGEVAVRAELLGVRLLAQIAPGDPWTAEVHSAHRDTVPRHLAAVLAAQADPHTSQGNRRPAAHDSALALRIPVAHVVLGMADA